MTDRAASVFLLGLVILIGASALAFIVWLLSSLVGEIYDHVTGQWRRIENAHIDANYAQGQFSVGRDVKDCKNG
jgi:hypothetical protein